MKKSEGFSVFSDLCCVCFGSFEEDQGSYYILKSGCYVNALGVFIRTAFSPMPPTISVLRSYMLISFFFDDVY